MDAVGALLERVRAQGVGVSSEINPFWRRLIEPLGPVLDAGGKLTSAELNRALGYGAARLPSGTTSNRDLPQWAGQMRAVETLDVSGLGKGIEHVAILHYLKQKGVLDDYVAWLDARRLVSNLGTGRLYWYAERLAKVLGERNRAVPQIFLEIGVGSGMFAIMMAGRGLVRHYVLVDLPEMLLNAMLHIRELLPQARMVFGEAPEFSETAPTFWFLETSDISKTPDASVDVSINFNSFMEMDEEVRNFYIGEIYRASKPGSLFYNVNRCQRAMTRRNGKPYENNPLLYPYKASDLVIEWEPDECQECARSNLFSSPQKSFSISRIAEIRPAG